MIFARMIRSGGTAWNHTVVVPASEFFHAAFLSWCSINEYNKQRWYYLRSAVAPAFKFGFIFSAWDCYDCLNDDDQQLVRFLSFTWAVLLTVELFLPSSWGYHNMINDDQQHRSYLGSSTAVTSILWSYLSVFWCWYLMNHVDYLKLFRELLPAIGSFFKLFGVVTIHITSCNGVTIIEPS